MRLWRHLTALRLCTRALRSHCTNNQPGRMLSRRVRLRKYCCQVRRYVLGSLPAPVVVHPGGGSAAAYLRWGCRVRRCVSTQFGQRVCPWVALFGQSLHSPSFLRRWRFSRDCTRERSRFSSSVSWGLVGSMAGVRLAETALVLRLGGVGFVFLRFLRWGITKVDSKVCSLHTPACAGTTGVVVAGDDIDQEYPRCTGTTHRELVWDFLNQEYSRVYGNSSLSFSSTVIPSGIPPCVWGQLFYGSSGDGCARNTPMCVGTACGVAELLGLIREYPHACGDSAVGSLFRLPRYGIPPRVWGQRALVPSGDDHGRNTPACSGTALVVE